MCSRLTDVGKMGNARMKHTRGRAPMWLSDKDTEIGESDIKVISKFAASGGMNQGERGRWRHGLLRNGEKLGML